MITNIKETIDNLESLLSELKQEYAKETERIYRESSHKSFKKGDWVYNGERYGKVFWVANDACNLSEEDGYVGIDLYSGTRGFYTGKRDDWNLMSEEDVHYLTAEHDIRLTGEEIQVVSNILLYSSSNIGNEVAKTLKAIGHFSLVK